MKSEEQVGHRPDSKHKTRVVCRANAARKSPPKDVLTAQVWTKCTASQCSRGCLLPSTGQGRNSTFCRQSRLEVKTPCNQQPEGQRRRRECQGPRCSGVPLCFRPPSPAPGGPLPPGEESQSPGPGISRRVGTDARPGSPQGPAKGKLKAGGGAPRLRGFVP